MVRGGAILIGSNLVEELVAKGTIVRIVNNPSGGMPYAGHEADA